LSSGAFVASFLVCLDVIDKPAVLVGVIALSRGIPMGEAQHIAVLIVGHERSRHRSGSCGAPRLTAVGNVSPSLLSTLALLGEGCCHHIRSVLFFGRTLPFVTIPLSSILDGGCLQ
jgi:hypothetical protein